jgi:hypothetical protein
MQKGLLVIIGGAGIKAWRSCKSVPEWPDVARFVADHFRWLCATFLHTFPTCGYFGGAGAGYTDHFHFCTPTAKPISSIAAGRPTPTTPTRRSDLPNPSQHRSCLSRVERAGGAATAHDVRVRLLLQPATRGATPSHSLSFLVPARS